MITGQAIGEGRPEDHTLSGKVRQDGIPDFADDMSYIPPPEAPSVRKRGGVIVIIAALFGFLLLLDSMRMIHQAHDTRPLVRPKGDLLPLYVEPSSIPSGGLPALGDTPGPPRLPPGMEVVPSVDISEEEKLISDALKMALARSDAQRGGLVVGQALEDAGRLAVSLKQLPVEKADTTLPSTSSVLTSPILSEVSLKIVGTGESEAMKFSRLILRLVAAKLSDSPLAEEIEKEFRASLEVAEGSIRPFLKSLEDLWGEDVAKQAAEYLLRVPGQSGEKIDVSEEMDRTALFMLASFKSTELTLLKKELEAKAQYEEALKATGSSGRPLAMIENARDYVAIEDVGSDEEEDRKPHEQVTILSMGDDDSRRWQSRTFVESDTDEFREFQKSSQKLAELRQLITALYTARVGMYKTAAEELKELEDVVPMLMTLYCGAQAKEFREIITDVSEGKWTGFRMVGLLIKANKAISYLDSLPPQKDPLFIPLLSKFISLQESRVKKALAEERLYFGRDVLDTEAVAKLEVDIFFCEREEESLKEDIARRVHEEQLFIWSNALA